MGRSMTRGVRLLANRGDVGGGEVMLLRLATALRELGRLVTVVAPQTPSETADLLDSAGFEVERVPARTRRGYLAALRRRHGRDDGSLLWCNGLLPAVALSGRGHRVVHLHQLPVGRAQAALARIARAGALATVVPSAWMAERLPGSVVLENWVPEPAEEARPRRSRSEAETASPPLRVGFLGRLSAEKGFPDLLRAADLLEESRPGTMQLLVAGDHRFVPADQEAEIAASVAAAGDRVRLLGWVPRERLLGGIDLLAVPSRFPESFGLVAAEAMAARVPVLVADAGALPEVVGPEHPLVVEAGDPASLAAGIERFRELDADGLVEQQHRRWEQQWSPEAGRRRVEAFLQGRGIR